MNNIVYLIGAGASRKILPIVNEIPKRLSEKIDFLQSDKYNLSDRDVFPDLNLSDTKRTVQLRLLDDLKWLLEASERHASIDTFAKKLYVKHDFTNLRRLKAALSIFFILEQFGKPADKRYDTFFASILNDSYNDFPNHIRILSWNYDYQFEISYSEYTNNTKITTNQSILNVVSKYEPKHSNTNRFTIFKLNGSTGLYGDRGFSHYKFVDDFNGEISIPVIDMITRNYTALIFHPTQFHSTLSFAWEAETEENSIINQASKSIENASVLVVIGYSFPYFNREIDSRLLKNMKSLTKVYFQSPDAENLKERFETIRDDLVDSLLVLKRDTAQFLLPNEL